MNLWKNFIHFDIIELIGRLNMKKFPLLISILMVFILFVADLSAQESGSGDKVVYKQKTIIDFSDVTIQGEL